MTISGLHSCKPGNEPTVGQVKTFVVEQRTGKNNKPYTKIKSASSDAGGSPYTITSVKPTGFTDSYGNISFNLEIEPVAGSTPQPTQQTQPQGRTGAGQGNSNGGKEGYWERKEQRDLEQQPRIERQHSQEMAIRMFAITQSKPTTEELRKLIDWFQRDISRSPEKQQEPPPSQEDANDEPPF